MTQRKHKIYLNQIWTKYQNEDLNHKSENIKVLDIKILNQY